MPFGIAAKLIFLTLLFTAAPAYAQQADECVEYVAPEELDSPQRLALRGVACFEAGEYLHALRHYRRARELTASNLFDAAIGRTFHELGYGFIARRYYRDYLAGRHNDGENQAKIEQRLHDVDAQLAAEGSTVRVTSSPPGANLFVVIEDTHWEPLGVTPIDIDLRPGKHTFIIEQPGYLTHSTTVDIGSKQDRVVKAELVSTAAPIATPKNQLRHTGLITMAASVPFLVVGPSMYFIGKNQRAAALELSTESGEAATQRATRLQSVGIAASVVGVAALGTGVALYLLGRPSTPDDSAEANFITPFVGPREVGVSFRF